jgi:outer membrane immunogenic protein
MKKLLIAAGILALSAGMGSAADMRMPVKAKPVVAPPYSWSGFYIGGNAGYGWGQATTDQTVQTQDFATLRAFSAGGAPLAALGGIALPFVGPTTTVTSGASSRANVDGFVGGGQIGYNWHFDRSWLVGLEADFQGSTQQGASSVCSVANCALGSFFGSADTRLTWFGTVRGRLGFLPHERILLYATGGFAYGKVDVDYVGGVNGGTLLAASTSTIHTGWTAGGGVEGAIDRNWTVKLEYLYMDLGSDGASLGSATTNTVGPLFQCPNDARCQITATNITSSWASTRFTDHILRAGFNYRF